MIAVIGMVTPTLKPGSRLVENVERPGGITVSIVITLIIATWEMQSIVHGTINNYVAAL